MLVKEAMRAVRVQAGKKLSAYGPVWAAGGAVVTGIAWLIAVLL